jgi:chitin disaccharide deacetylase
MNDSTTSGFAAEEPSGKAAAILSPESPYTGRLIVNADDWGQDKHTTREILGCVLAGGVSSVSAMVFMEDSERAAAIARERGIDTGLHLNFTSPFSAPGTPRRLIEHQQRVTRYLRGHRFARVVFNPVLTGSFGYVLAAQLEEYRRLYGMDPERIDGHHHMHLCANILFPRLLPSGTLVRRNFCFHPGEKSAVNRTYRRLVDGMLMRRHRLVDFLFNLAPLEPLGRLDRIWTLARRFVVEIETHPVNRDEYEFLSCGDIFGRVGDLPIERSFVALRGVRRDSPSTEVRPRPPQCFRA